MTTGSDELPTSPSDALNEALVGFAACMGEAVPDICSYGLTYGDTYVPFDPDDDDEVCDENEAMCSQIWVRVTDVAPSPGAVEGWQGDCAIELTLGLEVGIIRCVDIPEGGEAPKASDTLAAAMQAMSDMLALHCAAMGCEVWSSISTGAWEPMSPIGGQYGGVWTFAVTL